MKHKLDFETTFQFFKNHIDSKKAFSKFILKCTSFSEGDFFACVPNSPPLERLYQFKVGGLAFSASHVPSPAKASSIDMELAEFIQQFLKTDQYHLAIFENFNAVPEEPDLSLEGQQLAFHNKDVYYISTPNTSLEDIFGAIKETQMEWHSLIALSKYEKQITSHILKNELETLATNASILITTAYDGEGYIIWEKR